MLPLSLLLFLTSVLADDLSPAELVKRLASPDRVVREEAARTLEEEGQRAVPALGPRMTGPGWPRIANDSPP